MEHDEETNPKTKWKLIRVSRSVAAAMDERRGSLSYNAYLSDLVTPLGEEVRPNIASYQASKLRPGEFVDMPLEYFDGARSGEGVDDYAAHRHCNYLRHKLGMRITSSRFKDARGDWFFRITRDA